ncbi:FCD domain protein [Rhodococcus sp. MTM3W5.2]|uniref:GntR family transcriptional regulator n=1 Tax=Rhodococcus sp. MTM3W5.2 TaxID=1805827 RepID=UPI0009796B41|nr:GntR family transcriptional regulator [Rhodococcus sp. MTM3W5.2]AQA26199.1 FCD domain protein [Rhodococcus sp. MTM3W5.2]
MPRRPSLLVANLSGRDPGSSQTVILEELRRVILSGGAPPGTPIPVDEVADHFGVSRIPIRESLKTLIGEGLVDHRANAGYSVARLTVGELEELYLVRAALESAAHEVAIGLAEEADHDRARRAYAALDRSVLEDDRAAYHRESRNFHLALAAPCRMQRVLHMFESAWNITEPLRPMAQVATPARIQLHHDHREMLEAFLSRDAGRLKTVTDRHNDRLGKVIAALPTDTGLFRDTPGGAP